MMRRKSSLILLCVVMCIITLVMGCVRETGESGEGNVEEISLYILTGPTWIPLFHEMADNFMEEHPQIKLRLEIESSNMRIYYTKLLTRIAGGTAPDVAYIHPTWIIPFAEKNAVVELTPFLEKDEEVGLDSYYPIAIEPYKYKGGVYGLPADFSCYVVYYNQNLFDEAKIAYPEDGWAWNDYLRIARALTKDFDKDGRIDQFGCAGYGTGYGRFDAIWQAGGEIVDDYENPRRCLLDSPEAIEGLQFCVDLVRKYHVAPTQPTEAGPKTMNAHDMFVAGKIAMLCDGCHITPLLRDKIRDFKWDVVCLPKGKKKAAEVAGISVAICAKPKHPQASWKLVKYIAGPGGQSFLVKTGWPIPSFKSQELREMFLSSHPPDNRQAFLDTVNYTRFLPKTVCWSEASHIIQEEVEAAFVGQKSSADALRSATSRVNALLEDERK